MYFIKLYQVNVVNNANSVNSNLLKVNNRNTRKRCEKCTKLTIKTLFKNKKKHVRLPVQFTKLLRTPILKNSCVQLLVMRLLSYTRSSHWRCSVKTSVLKNQQILQVNTSVGVSFFIKLQASRPATLSKRDSNTGVYL